jgi:hypothetical protein
MKKTKLIEHLFPFLVAWSTNRRIKEQTKEKKWDTLFNYWKKTINVKETHSLEKAVDDLYRSEIQRKETIESKAASLFEAIGFAASLVSIAIVLAEKSSLLILSVLPLVNFILAGICSWHATKIGEFFLPTLEGIRENLELTKTKQEKESKIHWMIEKLVSTEMNCPFILIRSNWLAAAYQHFLLGILSLIIFFVAIFFEPYFIQILGVLNSVFLQGCSELLHFQ